MCVSIEYIRGAGGGYLLYPLLDENHWCDEISARSKYAHECKKTWTIHKTEKLETFIGDAKVAEQTVGIMLFHSDFALISSYLCQYY